MFKKQPLSRHVRQLFAADRGDLIKEYHLDFQQTGRKKRKKKQKHPIAPSKTTGGGGRRNWWE